ncbi:alanine--tRNA ligase [Pontimonas sp.]|nr:alanine--tRNA ligase [Pontimonas sp.]
METADIQRRWLTYFADRGHTVVPSASLVSDDPTLMFTVAGMVPFIPYLTGVVPAPYPRATSVQKCIRTLDIEEVGKTTRHGTFFQMNGNFSFGDYFKEGAIEYAWELLTSSESDGGLGFAESDLWGTVYEDDAEAEKLWKDIAGLPAQRIQRMGREDNYWSTGQPGPAGPCSEIYFDRGAKYGPKGGPAVDDTRYIEIWNLVFMQYLIGNVTSKVDFDIVGDLPQKNIDTGMGMERVAFLKQGVENMYEIDQVRPVLDAASELSGRRYGADHEDDVRMRVIADHIRSSLMLMTDGVVPANEGRGYVLRRLLRRSIRSMRLLGVEEATFPTLFSASRDAMAPAYPDVAAEFSRVSGLVEAEEASFLKTLEAGITILDVAVQDTHTKGDVVLPGDAAFLLHDTYGFPIDLTLEMAEEAGLSVDRASFDALMQEQRSRAKGDAKSKKSLRADLSVYGEFRQAGETVFTGYTMLDTQSSVLGILVEGVSVTSVPAGVSAEVILAETPLYAESGGQVADHGTMEGASFSGTVTDVQRPVSGLISHTITVNSGALAVGDVVDVHVDHSTRYEGQRAHSATHLIHAALRDTLGPFATQAGSLNRPGYLRLDFSWNQALSKDAQDAIGEISNAAITQDLEVTTRLLPVAEAKAQGAMALFGEKYGDVVRMVDIGGPWSRELCAGTHVSRSSQIGVVSVLGESSVSSTARRIEALVGTTAVADFSLERSIMRKLTGILKTPREELPKRVEELVSQVRDLERAIEKVKQAAAGARVPELAAAVIAGPVSHVVSVVSEVGSADELRSLVHGVLTALGTAPAVVALGCDIAGRATIVVGANPEAVAKGAHAGELVTAASAAVGGRGGGKPGLAQGGGPDGTGLAAALSAVGVEVERL